MPYLSLPVHVLRVEGFLALGEVVRRDLFVLVFEACFVTKRTFFLLRAFATPKVHLGEPLAVVGGCEAGVVFHAKQQVADEVAINAVVPRAQLAAVNGLLPRREMSLSSYEWSRCKPANFGKSEGDVGSTV